MATHSLVIDGKNVPGTIAFPVINPATGEAFAEAPDCSRAQLDAAMEAAKAAFRPWAGDEAKRREALIACADLLAAASAEIAPILTQEQGKPLVQAQMEILGASMWFRATAGLEIPVEVLHEDDKQRVELHRKPIGVVGAITPWNFPVILAVWKIASALLAGNTLVLKPSPFTPLSSLEMGRLLQDALPPGVFNVVSGGDQLGAWISGHPAVRKISFTGSVPTGKKIMASAAPDLKRITLELGGNDPAIVLADANPTQIAEKLFAGAFNNSGQICMAVKRVYVEEANFTALVEALADRAQAVVLGDGMETGVTMGPVNNLPQYTRVWDLLESARNDGAEFVTGGKPLDRPGYFIPPTLVTGIEDGSRLVDEEQFGPALPIIPVGSAEEAVERANASHFGLGGSVWTADLDRGAQLASQLDCGTGWVNQHGALTPFAPFGGRKWSGIGYENGKWGLDAFTELQTLALAKS